MLYLLDIHVFKKHLYFICLVLICNPLAGQDSYTGDNLVKSIEKISKIITSKNEEILATTKNYSLLESKINSRQELLGKFSKDRKQLVVEIDSLTKQINQINAKLGVLRKEYSRMIKLNYMQSLTEQKWSYILSSKTLIEGYKKWIFSKQYNDFLNKQRDALYGSLDHLQGSMQSLNTRISNKESLIQTENIHTKRIKKEERQKEKLILALEEKSDVLIEEHKNQKKQKETLKKEIENVITKQSSDNTSVAGREEFNPNLKKSSRGKLLWPIEGAVVTSHYGKHPHPTLKHVEILNNGIDLDGGANKNVRVVFDGEVIGRKKLADRGIMIIVKHGNYYSVYSKIVVANVRAGDVLTEGTVIGTVQDELHFEIWQGKEKLNPIHWLK